MCVVLSLRGLVEQAKRPKMEGNRALSSSVDRAYAEIVVLEYLCFQHNSAKIAVAVVSAVLVIPASPCAGQSLVHGRII